MKNVPIGHQAEPSITEANQILVLTRAQRAADREAQNQEIAESQEQTPTASIPQHTENDLWMTYIK